MPKIGIGDRLNINSKQSIIFTEEYRKVRLDPRTLIPSERNKYSQDDLEELADNMQLVGQLQEVIVGRVNGQDRIIVGHRRTAAAVLNINRGNDNFKLIDCKIKEMSEAMFMLTLHSANIFNRRLSDWELTEGLADFKKYLKEAEAAGEVVIGNMRKYLIGVTGESSGKIGQIDSINNNLCEEGKEAFKNGDINFTTAYETSRLPEDKQKEVIETGGMLSKEVKEMVRQEKEKEEQEDFDPKPDTVTALCYSCVHYEECHEKKSTVTSCDTYVDRKGAFKTDEQRYDEEQAAIDKDTKKKLREQEESAAVERVQEIETKEHDIRISKEKYKAIVANKLAFLLLKKDSYRIGEKLEVAEYKEGEPTGREIAIEVTYIWEDWTGLEEDYCIIGFIICEITEKDTGIPGQMEIEHIIQK